jgi:decaprenylphosphoryl-5-phosphoribose phosphatase
VDLDAAILHAAARLRRPERDRGVAAFSALGNYGLGWIAAGGAVAVARGSARPLVSTAGVVWGTLAANYGVKRVVRRARPARDDLPPPLIAAPATHSFPSSHAAMAAAGAIVLRRLVPALGAPVIATAALIAASRVYLAVHYPSDVAAGAALGVVTGSALTAALA